MTVSSGLIKAKIVNLSTNAEVTCLFNPEKYSVTKTNQWTSTIQKGQSLPTMEFEGGGAATLSLQLRFDTYEARGSNAAGKDVRELTKALWEMMKPTDINATTNRGAPPHVQFQWGSLWSFEAVITSITQTFTLFAKDGTPVRAELDVGFTQILGEDVYPRQNPTSGGNPGEHLRTVFEGETLAGIAYEEYGDPTVWRHLATTNNIHDPRRLRPGQRLLITPLPQE